MAQQLTPSGLGTSGRGLEQQLVEGRGLVGVGAAAARGGKGADQQPVHGYNSGNNEVISSVKTDAAADKECDRRNDPPDVFAAGRSIRGITQTSQEVSISSKLWKTDRWKDRSIDRSIAFAVLRLLWSLHIHCSNSHGQGATTGTVLFDSTRPCQTYAHVHPQHPVHRRTPLWPGATSSPNVTILGGCLPQKADSTR